MNGRRGFTLIEIMIALVLLMVVILGMATSTGRFIRVVATSDIQQAAIQLADDRIATILMDPNYGGLDSAYVATEGDFPGMDGFTRVTAITQVGGPGQTLNHKRIVVTVSGPGLEDDVKRSASVSAP